MKLKKKKKKKSFHKTEHTTQCTAKSETYSPIDLLAHRGKCRM